MLCSEVDSDNARPLRTTVHEVYPCCSQDRRIPRRFRGILQRRSETLSRVLFCFVLSQKRQKCHQVLILILCYEYHIICFYFILLWIISLHKSYIQKIPSKSAKFSPTALLHGGRHLEKHGRDTLRGFRAPAQNPPRNSSFRVLRTADREGFCKTRGKTTLPNAGLVYLVICPGMPHNTYEPVNQNINLKQLAITRFYCMLKYFSTRLIFAGG